MNKATSITKIGKKEIVEVNTNFYNGLLALEQAKAYLISPRDEAKIRIATASGKHIGKEYGTWTTTGFEYAKNSPVLLRLNSHLMDYQLAKQAVEANRQGRYFSSESKFYEESAKQAEHDKNEAPEKRKVLILPSKTNFQITSQSNIDVLEFLLGEKLAKEYYNFNGSKPITTYLVEPKHVDSQDGTLMTQLWLCRLGGGSDLVGSDRDLYDDSRVRGVRSIKTGEASSAKNLEKKTQELLNKYNILNRKYEDLKTQLEEKSEYLLNLSKIVLGSEELPEMPNFSINNRLEHIEKQYTSLKNNRKGNKYSDTFINKIVKDISRKMNFDHKTKDR